MGAASRRWTRLAFAAFTLAACGQKRSLSGDGGSTDATTETAAVDAMPPPVDTAPVDVGFEVAPADVPPAIGSPYRAIAVAAGRLHTCALLDDHRVKCWGFNDYGQLGLGDTRRRGESRSEMGDALPTVDLGAGRTAKAISAGRYVTCALLDDETVKCWGWNGQTGHREADGGALSGSLGDEPGEMGDALPIVDLGGRKARRLAVGYFMACAALDDESVTCWGQEAPNTVPALPARLAELKGGYAVLGLLEDGTVLSFGGGPVPPFDAPLRTIAGSRGGACGVRVEGGVACYNGQLRPLSSDASPVELAIAEQRQLCGLRRDGRVSCWGRSEPWAPEPADDGGFIVALGQPAVAMGGAGSDHMCALLADGGIKCWSWYDLRPVILGASLPDGTYADWRAIDLGTHPAR